MNADEILGGDFGLHDAEIPGHDRNPEQVVEVYTEEELKTRLEEIRASGVKEYPLMDI